MTANPVWRWFDRTFIDLGRQFRWSYLPPLMIYLAAGVQGLTCRPHFSPGWPSGPEYPGC